MVGRIVPSWNDDELRLTIEPAGGTAVRTSVFERETGGGASRLDRGTATREALEGTYRATLQSAVGGDVGWLSVSIDPEGATQFPGRTQRTTRRDGVVSVKVWKSSGIINPRVSPS